MISPRFDVFDQLGSCRWPHVFFKQVEFESQHIGGLRIGNSTSRSGHIFIIECRFDFCKKSSVFGFIGFFTKHLSRFAQDIDRVGIEGRGNVIRVGVATFFHWAADLSLIKQPVTKMKTAFPQSIGSYRSDPAYPFFHGIVLPLQQALVSINKVHVPGCDGTHIAPT